MSEQPDRTRGDREAERENRVAAIERLLADASDAHHVYERDELDGVYDEAWPEWYGAHVVKNGLGSVLGRDVTSEEAGTALTRLWEMYRRLDPKPTASWAAWTAARIATDL